LLARFEDGLGSHHGAIHWQLADALRKWADKQPQAAVAWMERMTAAEKFAAKSLDGANQPVVHYEAALAKVLLETDPAAATARVMALPDAQREELLQRGYLSSLAANHETAYADLVRKAMPPDKSADVFASRAAALALDRGLDRVDEFITGTRATSDEKQRIVTRVFDDFAGRNNSPDDLEKARAWATRHAPEIVDRATGEALANSLAKGVDFANAARLALRYHGSASGDALLAAFIRQAAGREQNAADAKALIDRIGNPALRKELRGIAETK
jgi:hypothetical protein